MALWKSTLARICGLAHPNDKGFVQKEKAPFVMKVLLSKFLEVVRLIGLEPTRPKSTDPKRYGLARSNYEGYA